MGASSGIGLALAEALASRGVRIGVAARHTDTLKALAESYPGMLEVMSIDVTRRDAVERLSELAWRLGGMDVYIHVAGIGFDNSSLEPEREVDIVRTNAVGFARMVSAAYRYFRVNGIKGQIAAVTSVAGTRGIDRLAAYSASKSFDQTYLEAMRQLADADGSGITVTDIRPGWVRTPLLSGEASYPLEMEAERVVAGILRAIVRRKSVAVIDWRWQAVVSLWRLLPSALWVRMHLKLSEPDMPLPDPTRNTGAVSQESGGGVAEP